ncbi:MAG TPA: helix-turn-helix transcriptional regulator [Candidatus Acidoferrales bacterium]|nr:helix-turn-helix transcriptional regulator [Candidatus Acidoferrales bacterium]
MSAARQHPALTLEQEPHLVVRSLATNFSSGYLIEEHAHAWRQLLYASAGAMTVYAGQWTWMIPPGRAVFIPAGRPHSIRMWGEVAMRSLCFPAALDQPALQFDDCRVIAVTPLLRELILRVIEMSALDGREAPHRRLLSVLLDEMHQAPTNPLVLPLPRDRRALAVAREVLTSPGVELSLDSLARRHGAGRRTLERLFRGETGISFGLWQQKARLLESVRALAEGRSVTNAALDAGYSSVSAFIAAFKRTFGCTPGRL